MAESDGRAILIDVARRAGHAGDAEAMATAICALVSQPGGSTSPGETDLEFVELAEDALAMLDLEGPSVLRVQLRSLLAVQLSVGADPERGLDLARACLDEALALGDPSPSVTPGSATRPPARSRRTAPTRSTTPEHCSRSATASDTRASR